MAIPQHERHTISGSCRDIQSRLTRHIQRLGRRDQELNRLSRRYWWARRLLFLVGALTTAVLFAYIGGQWGWSAAALFVLVFFVVTRYHGRVRTSISFNQDWIHIKQSQFARSALDWSCIPSRQASSTDGRHPFDADLDITGPRSLHQLLDISMTIEGSRRLRDWLLVTNPVFDTVRARQQVVKEISRLGLFREKLVLYSHLFSRTAPEGWQAGRLLTWIADSSDLRSLGPWLLVLFPLGALNLVLFCLFAAGRLPAYWVISVLVYLALMRIKFRELKNSFGEAIAIEAAIKLLLPVFAHLERYRHKSSPNLAKLLASFLDRDKRPSALLRRVSRVVSGLSFSRGNPYLWGPVQLAVPWDMFFAYLLGRCRTAILSDMPGWLETWHELEALASLANLAALHPEFVLPDVRPEGSQLSAVDLGHPLIACSKKVSNDFSIGEEKRIALITGSNMAGKSTFLRTLGINLVLAYAGAPVSASGFQAPLFSIFACIKVSDSLADGLSYFYAEVKRLKALLDSIATSASPPHFVLIDEIFRGTNNRERRIGSWSYIKALTDLPAVGAVATHDLELVHLEGEISSVANYHFREDVVDGKMLFDYKLRPGPCPTTNAIKIMKIEGLPVGPAPMG